MVSEALFQTARNYSSLARLRRGPNLLLFSICFILGLNLILLYCKYNRELIKITDSSNLKWASKTAAQVIYPEFRFNSFDLNRVNLAFGRSFENFRHYLEINKKNLVNADWDLQNVQNKISYMDIAMYLVWIFTALIACFWGLVAVIRPISRNSLRIRKLLIEKRQADIIAASISDGIFLLRGEEILYVNPTGERILGLKVGTFESYLKLRKKLDDTAGLKAIKKAVKHTLPIEFSFEDEDKKYSYLIQSISIPLNLIEEIENSVKKTVLSMLDRFQADTLVLAQDVSVVKEGQEAKRHFLATLSHEIKTPVTSLTMAIRLLKKSIDQIPNPTHKTLINTCVEDVDRLRGLLENLLNVTRFDTLAQRLEIQKIDLAKLLIHSVQSFQSEAREKGIDLNHSIINHGRPTFVYMDATKVAWALSNLITNALRHTPRGGSVKVSFEGLEEWAEVRVQDTGPGIDKHRLERVFDKFSSYYDLRVARSGSIGTSLAIAREIVAAHNGKIWVVSKVGQGAEFCFTLPFKRPESELSIADFENREVKQSIGRVHEKNRFSF